MAGRRVPLRVRVRDAAKALRSLIPDPLGLAVLGVSGAGHLVCLALAARVASPRLESLGGEARLLVGASLAASLVGAFLSNRLHYRVLLAARFAAIMVAFRILGPDALPAGILLLGLFWVDAAVHEASRPALAAVAVSTILALGNLASLVTASGALALGSAAIVLGAVVVGGGYVLVTHYREKLIVDERAIRDLNNAFEKIANSNLDLQSYAANAEAVSAGEERNRITRELHDSVGYAMTNIVATMNAAEILIQDRDLERLSALVANARETARGCLGETRATLYRLRSISAAAPRGLAMLSHLARVFSDATGVTVAMEYGDAAQSYGDEIDAAIYRFVQECLTNAFRHAKSANLKVRVMLHRQDQWIVVQAWDNGSGMQGAEEGIGLRGMRERIERLGGRLSYGNLPDGFEVLAALPLGKESTDGADQGAPR